MSTTWVFGYGSLVSPQSLARTIGRTARWGHDVVPARLDGWSRRWNYGSPRTGVGWRHDDSEIVDGVMICLGVVADEAEAMNGVIVAVDDDDLAALDRRERDYDRVDVTASTTVFADRTGAGRIDPTSVVVYVPRPSAVDRYEDARDRGTAAIRQSYWDLVDRAFSDLGDDDLAEYRRTRPPDVPVVDIDVDMDTLRGHRR